MYGNRNTANPARFPSFPPPAIILPPPFPAHDDPWPRFVPLQPVSPIAEPSSAEDCNQEISEYHRCTEAVAPDYNTSMMSVPAKVKQPVTSAPLLAVVINWLASLAPTFAFEPLLPR
jgi:hypothetical protein